MSRAEGLAGSFWPSETQVLLLRSILLEDERGREAWRALEHDFDIARIEEGSMVLLPLLHEMLKEQGLSHPLEPRLRGVYRYVWYRNQLGLASLRGLLDVLRAGEVEPALLGDAALIVQHYRRLGVRTLDELALLVEPDDLERAGALFADAGWQRVSGSPRGSLRFVEPRPDKQVTCSISIRASLELDAVPALRQRLWEQRQDVDGMGLRATTLATTHELVRSCVRAGRGGNETQWVVDAVTIFRGPATVDWDEAVLCAEQAGCAIRLRESLSFLAGAFDAPIPDDVIARLDAMPNTGRERFAHRVSGRGGHLTGNFPVAVASHVVARQEESVLRTLATLPGFLGSEWGLEHAWQLPAAFLRRAASAIGGRTRRRRLERRWEADAQLRGTAAGDSGN